MAHTVESLEHGRTVLLMWLGALGPPVVWAVQLSSLYVLATALCAPGTYMWLYVITLVALILDVGAGVLAWRCYRLARRLGRNGDTAATRTRFFGLTGMFASAIFAVGIVAQALPLLLHDACA